MPGRGRISQHGGHLSAAMTIGRRFVDALAEKAISRLVRQSIRQLQRMTEERTSGADSGLANVWDEICVQIQGEESIHWAAYDATVRQIIRFDLKQISDVELESIWVQTDSGWDWWDDQEEAR